MRNLLLFTLVFCFVLTLPLAAVAEVRLFTGNLEVITTSGKVCAGRKGTHLISLVIGGDDTQDAVFGYVGGDTVTVGQLRGTSSSSLTLRYPFPDADRAEGHTMTVDISGAVLSGELHDRHLDADVDDCNFDLARIELRQNDSEEAANAAYQRLSLQYEAQLARATALSVSRTGSHGDATALFEKALNLADKLYPQDSARLLPYLTGLANNYMRTGRHDDFGRLYSLRIDSLHDDAVRVIFSHHQIRSLLQVGRAALAREDYQTALYNFRQALKIDYKNKDAIAATMSALVRSGQHDEAITFLSETEQKLDNEPDRQDVREAIALVVFQKAKKESIAGRQAEAERSVRKAAKLDPGTVYYLVVLARMVHKTGRYAEADAILKRGLDTFKEEKQRQELIEAREKLRQTEMILAKLRKAGA
jgi:tetratricopeptide (TPR) repeat protein